MCVCVCGVGFGSGECATHIHVDKQSIDKSVSLKRPILLIGILSSDKV